MNFDVLILFLGNFGVVVFFVGFKFVVVVMKFMIKVMMVICCVW